MIKWNEKKFTLKFGTLFLIGLLICDVCLALNPKNNTVDKVDSPKITHVTSINSPKTTCTHTFADGTKAVGECPLDITPKKTDNVTTTIPTISTVKPSNENKNESTAISTTENPEVASMTDNSHKYTGGLDVDEIKPNNITNLNTTNSNKNAELSTSKPNTTVYNDKVGNHNASISNNKSTNITTEHILLSKISDPRNFRSTTAAGVAAGICVALACMGYASLMIWRRIYYQRYGNREMLLNEDDLGDIHDEDMRHFELKLLNKDGKVIETS